MDHRVRSWVQTADGTLLYAPRKTKSIAAITTEAQKIPIPAITSPGSVSRAFGGGTSGMRIFLVLLNGSVMAGGREA
jgi:2-keto-3-deoxy-6-phosphogluconate aldolase